MWWGRGVVNFFIGRFPAKFAVKSLFKIRTHLMQHRRQRGARGACPSCRTRSSAIAEGPRDASCQLKSCQLPRNSTETTCTTSHEQIKVMKLEGYSGTMSNKHVHSSMTRSSRFHCLIGVINKPTTVEFCLSCAVFTARCYAFAVLAMGLCLSVCPCPSVCHKSEFY